MQIRWDKFGNAIASYMDAQELSFRDMQARSGVDKAIIFRVRNGDLKCSAVSYLALCQTIGAKPTDFVAGK
jgi:hypothetical protein